MARKPPKGKSLAEVNPELAKQWHTSKNGDLTPNDFIPGSENKVWWQCDKAEDHEWKSTIKNRSKGSGCGVCAGQIIVLSNCPFSSSTLNISPTPSSTLNKQRIWSATMLVLSLPLPRLGSPGSGTMFSYS